MADYMFLVVLHHVVGGCSCLLCAILFEAVLRHVTEGDAVPGRYQGCWQLHCFISVSVSFLLHLHHVFWWLHLSCDWMPLFFGSSASCQWWLDHIVGGCVISLAALHRITGCECEKAALTWQIFNHSCKVNLAFYYIILNIVTQIHTMNKICTDILPMYDFPSTKSQKPGESLVSHQSKLTFFHDRKGFHSFF